MEKPTASKHPERVDVPSLLATKHVLGQAAAATVIAPRPEVGASLVVRLGPATAMAFLGAVAVLDVRPSVGDLGDGPAPRRLVAIQARTGLPRARAAEIADAQPRRGAITRAEITAKAAPTALPTEGAAVTAARRAARLTDAKSVGV